MTEQALDLFVSIGGASDAGVEDLDTLAHELIRDLDELDSIVAVTRVSDDEVPDGAKGSGTDVQTILIKLAELGGIKALVSVLSTWLSRDKNRSVKLQLGSNSLEVTGLSEEKQLDLMDWFKVQSALHLAP
jgi:hypothetical protein